MPPHADRAAGVADRLGGHEGRCPFGAHERDDVLARAHRVAPGQTAVDRDKLGAVPVRAHLEDKFQTVAHADGLGVVRRGELRQVHVHGQQTAGVGRKGLILRAVERGGLTGGLCKSRARAIGVVTIFGRETVAVYAAAQGHAGVRQRRAVRAEQLHLRDRGAAQLDGIERIQLAPHAAALAALERETGHRAAVGHAAADRRRTQVGGDAVRLEQRQRAVAVRRKRVGLALAVLIGDFGPDRRGELEQVQPVLQRLDIDLDRVAERGQGAVRGGDGVRAVPQAAQQQDGLGQVARVGILLERRVQAALAVVEADRALRLVLDRPALTGRGAPLDRVIQDAPVEVPGVDADGLHQAQLAAQSGDRLRRGQTAYGLARIRADRRGGRRAAGNGVFERDLVPALAARQDLKRAGAVDRDRRGGDAPGRVCAVFRLRGDDIAVLELLRRLGRQGIAARSGLFRRCVDGLAVLFDRERELTRIRVRGQVEIVHRPADLDRLTAREQRRFQSGQRDRRRLRANEDLRVGRQLLHRAARLRLRRQTQDAGRRAAARDGGEAVSGDGQAGRAALEHGLPDRLRVRCDTGACIEPRGDLSVRRGVLGEVGGEMHGLVRAQTGVYRVRARREQQARPAAVPDRDRDGVGGRGRALAAVAALERDAGRARLQRRERGPDRLAQGQVGAAALGGAQLHDLGVADRPAHIRAGRIIIGIAGLIVGEGEHRDLRVLHEHGLLDAGRPAAADADGVGVRARERDRRLRERGARAVIQRAVIIDLRRVHGVRAHVRQVHRAGEDVFLAAARAGNVQMQLGFLRRVAVQHRRDLRRALVLRPGQPLGLEGLVARERHGKDGPGGVVRVGFGGERNKAVGQISALQAVEHGGFEFLVRAVGFGLELVAEGVLAGVLVRRPYAQHMNARAVRFLNRVIEHARSGKGRVGGGGYRCVDYAPDAGVHGGQILCLRAVQIRQLIIAGDRLGEGHDDGNIVARTERGIPVIRAPRILGRARAGVDGLDGRRGLVRERQRAVHQNLLRADVIIIVLRDPVDRQIPVLRIADIVGLRGRDGDFHVRIPPHAPVMFFDLLIKIEVARVGIVPVFLLRPRKVSQIGGIVAVGKVSRVIARRASRDPNKILAFLDRNGLGLDIPAAVLGPERHVRQLDLRVRITRAQPDRLIKIVHPAVGLVGYAGRAVIIALRGRNGGVDLEILRAFDRDLFGRAVMLLPVQLIGQDVRAGRGLSADLRAAGDGGDDGVRVAGRCELHRYRLRTGGHGGVIGGAGLNEHPGIPVPVSLIIAEIPAQRVHRQIQLYRLLALRDGEVLEEVAAGHAVRVEVRLMGRQEIREHADLELDVMGRGNVLLAALCTQTGVDGQHAVVLIMPGAHVERQVVYARVRRLRGGVRVPCRSQRNAVRRGEPAERLRKSGHLVLDGQRVHQLLRRGGAAGRVHGDDGVQLVRGALVEPVGQLVQRGQARAVLHGKAVVLDQCAVPVDQTELEHLCVKLLLLRLRREGPGREHGQRHAQAEQHAEQSCFHRISSLSSAADVRSVLLFRRRTQTMVSAAPAAKAAMPMTAYRPAPRRSSTEPKPCAARARLGVCASLHSVPMPVSSSRLHTESAPFSRPSRRRRY